MRVLEANKEVTSEKKPKRRLRGVAFTLIIASLLGICNYLAQPIWLDWNNYNTTKGFYQEPRNTIETVFLGASIVVTGISPMELYEEYGICSYNLATEQQPMLASYYWLEEAYRLHPETLSTVVLDVSMLRRTPSDAFYYKALDNMNFSAAKSRAFRHFSENGREYIMNMVPLLSYHDRWDSLKKQDFTRGNLSPNRVYRGFYPKFEVYSIYAPGYSSITVPLYKADTEKEEKLLDTEALVYLKKMIQFCNSKGLQMVLMKIPVAWNSSCHNAVQHIADNYNIPFLDYNIDPYLSELNFNFAADSFDESQHPNYNGARKITKHLGNYLSSELHNRDVRGENGYLFLEEQLSAYRSETAVAAFKEFHDPVDYLSHALNMKDCAVLVSVKDEATDAMTDVQRDYFRSIGLQELSTLSYRESYLAVLESGNVVYEQSCKAGSLDSSVDAAEVEKEIDEDKTNDIENIESIYEQQKIAEKSKSIELKEEHEPTPYLLQEGKLCNGAEYSIKSGGAESGDVSSICINGKEYSPNNRGLNIVVYDTQKRSVLDAAHFDTHAAPTRKTFITGNAYGDKVLTDYNRASFSDYFRRILKSELREDDLFAYLSPFLSTSGYIIYISVNDDAANALTPDVRSSLASLGLTELSKLRSQESYLAEIKNGVVLFETTNRGEESLEVETTLGRLVSAGDHSSITIEDQEYSPNKRGLNIVIYDTVLKTVVDSTAFDTSTITPKALG